MCLHWLFFFFSSRRRHTRCSRDWSSDVCSSDLLGLFQSLPTFEFIYLAPTARLFQAAESEFYHVLYGVRDHSKSINALDYFRIRRAWEAKERVASADVVLLKEAQARYSARQFQELYENWSRGAMADAEVTQHSK